MPVIKEPTSEEIEAYKAKWAGHLKVGAGRVPNEVMRFMAERKYRSPDPNLPRVALPDGRGGLHGLPHPDSPYRCQGWCRTRNARCNSWAVRGQKGCKYHGGGKAISKRRKNGKRSRYKNPIHQLLSLPAVYSKYLGPKLNERLAELAGVPDELDLSNELRLVRSATLDIAMMYSAIMEMPCSTPAEIAKRQELLVETGQLMKESAVEVAEMAARVVDIQAKRNDKLTVQSLGVVTTQIVEMAYEAFGEESGIIDKVHTFADKIKGLRLPSDAALGTTITPDMDVAAMDATIPNV